MGDAHIFISHSQRDDGLRDRFLCTFALAGIKGIAFEFDRKSGRVPAKRTPADAIRQSVQSARALFLLITQNVVSRHHTNNWVAFELGLAYGHTPPVPIWVFEEMWQKVDFPVPALNHHVLFDSKSKEHWDWIRYVAEGYKEGQPFDPSREPLGMMLEVCPHENCKAKFKGYYPSSVKSWKCPSCRQLCGA